MTGWLIITIIAVLVCAGCWVIVYVKRDYYDNTGWVLLGSFFTMIAVVFIGITVFTPPSVKIQMGVFDSQKAYVESHVAKNALEDATITNMKIEMNDWLFSAQQNNRVWGIFSFYPDEILNLEPIQ